MYANGDVREKWGEKGGNQGMGKGKGIGDKNDSRGGLQRKDGETRGTVGEWDGRRGKGREKVEG